MSQISNRPVDWETLVKENEDRLYRAALAILGDAQEAEDAVQDTFLKFLEKAPAELDSPPAWLMRVLVNGCRDRLRAAWRRRSVPLWESLPAPEPEERQELEEIFPSRRLTGLSSICFTTRDSPPERSPGSQDRRRGPSGPGSPGPGPGSGDC